MRKLTPAQINYTTTERELPSIVETLRESRTIILGHRIIVYTDNKNLTFENFTTERVQHWRLMMEEYEPKIKYIKVTDNDAVDTLSGLPLIKYDVKKSDVTREKLVESYGVDQLEGKKTPLTYQTINKYQLKDKELIEKLKCANYER